MKALVCASCGATGLQVKSTYMLCEYCGTKFLLSSDEYDLCSNRKNVINSGRDVSCSTSISLDYDIEQLLNKCRANPRNARRYANLILDIDPDNQEALEFLKYKCN